MLTLVTGGSGSGKSAFAEDRVLSFGEGKRIYIATMHPFDEESHKRIERHRKMRAGKGFETVECYTGLKNAVLPGESGKCVVLLECMSNLAANEMFSREQPVDRETVIAKILQGIEVLRKQADPLVIVTNNVFEDGIAYDSATIEYIEALGRVNERLAAEADEVVEVVAGIPQRIKPGSPGAKAQNRQDSRG